MKHSRATEEALDRLHRELADTLREGVEKVKTGISSGEEVKGAAALLNVARQFLKDNGIEHIPQPGDETDNLVKSLPFQSDTDSMFKAH